jgi:serine/threonine-protein kinase
MAMADSAGRIWVADKEAHAIRRVDPDGTIHTVAGTGQSGDDGDGPGLATAMRLVDPNGLHVTNDDITFILDLGNGKIRRLEGTTMTTFITVPGGIATGRGLWVSDDEQLAYMAAGDRVLQWRAGVGLSVLATGFVSLGNLTVDPSGELVVTDRGGHLVYRVSASGARTILAGNGLTEGGGDGQRATESALNEPRAIAFTDDGGFFVGTHEGNQLWWVAPEGTIHLFLDGGDNHAHSGDGRYFRSPGEKVSEVRSVTLDRLGHVIIVENDFGFVRRVALR